MSETSPRTEFNQEKRKLLYWISQWSHDLNHVQNIPLDISDLAVLLQIMGFKLEVFDRKNNVQDGLGQSSNNETFMLQLELTCKKSGMICKFSKPATVCKCPTEHEVEKGQFWSVTGCAPSSSSEVSVSSSTSSLIPTVSKGKVEIVSYLMSKIFSITNDKESSEQKKSDANLSQNALLTRHRSLDTLKSKEGSGIFREKIKRELSWEGDMAPSPPTQTSSPVPNLTLTLSRISLDSNSKNAIIKKLSAIQKLSTEALEMVGGKGGLQKKRISDIKPTEGPNSSELPLNGISTPRKRVTPKRLLNANEKSGIPTPTMQKLGTRATMSKFQVITQAAQQLTYKSKLSKTTKTRNAVGLPSTSRGVTQPSTSGVATYRSLKK